MIPAWRRKLRGSRPERMAFQVRLGPVLKARYFDEAEALQLHPDQLATEIIEAWLVGRKRLPVSR